MLGDIAQNEVGGDGCNLVEAGLTKFALDVEFFGEIRSLHGFEHRLPLPPMRHLLQAFLLSSPLLQDFGQRIKQS